LDKNGKHGLGIWHRLVNVALSVFLGVVIGWLAGVPLLVHYYQITLQTQSATEIANNMWHSHIRYIGVGTMLIGGLWTIVTLFKPILQSLHASFLTIRESRRTQTDLRLRTEKDIPMNYVFWSLALLFIPLFCLVAFFLLPNTNTISSQFRLILAAFSALYILIGGFIFCSISAYFAGLIGSSNNPVSGLLVSALLILCLGILVLFHFNVGIKGNELLGVMAAIGSAVVMGSALAISNDTMQDLKVGQLIGATPWKQQVMLLLGVVASAFVIPPILELLFNAYGIGGVFPHVGMPKEQMLAAPQAGLMAAVAQGIYAHNLLWNMIYTGLAVGFVCIVVDEILKRIDLRLPVLAVGLGIYLPLDSSMPVVIGGLLTFIIQLRLNYLYKSHAPAQDLAIAPHKQRGLLLVCGIVAGSSIVGVVLAIPFALKQSSNALRIMPDQYAYLSGILSIFVTLALCAWIAKTVIKK
jgi:putative OPT family oligopeptide transporter